MPIHPTALVAPEARIAESAEIGPYSIIGPEVEIGARTRLVAHVYVEGPTWIGEDNVFFPYCTVGVASQDLKYRGERTETRIGHRNRIREFVTIHRGTEGGGRLTVIGDDNLLMAYVHIAHDVRVGDHTVLANGVTVGGHVTIGDWAVIGAFTGLHQFCRVGRHAMIGGYSVVTQDVLPYSLTCGQRDIKVYGANRTGLERRGFPASTIESLQRALRLLTRSGLNTTQAIARIREEVPPCPEVEELIAFIAASERGVIK
ncbi:MAG: acyl-ACP--UDP-N-acetylglucosamine O-acyltransferase [Bryobacterales bacterium]|nr:acyl-ACP--UDP-N-acetylglucosamine O-acyltransferase [Bryobacteraceae bacterium]MDW8129324.1 acyl-ACP--UDP-N-acetylglucosamine O-acyltransferase [Bryobacterales bacterium]